MKRTAQEMLGTDAGRNERHEHGQSRGTQAESSTHRVGVSDASNTSGRGSGTSSSEAAESSAAAAQRRKHNEAGHSQAILTIWNEKDAADSGSDPKTHRSGSSGDNVKEVRMDLDNCASVPQELGQAGAPTTVTATTSNLAQAKQKQKQIDGQPSSGVETSSALPTLPAANTQHGSGAGSSRTPHAGQSGSGQAVESAEDKHKKAQLQLIFDELVCDICLELMVDPAGKFLEPLCHKCTRD